MWIFDEKKYPSADSAEPVYSTSESMKKRLKRTMEDKKLEIQQAEQ